MKYAVEMGSGAKFYKDWFRHSADGSVGGGGVTETHSMVIA
jgi:hypothetical protein